MTDISSDPSWSLGTLIWLPIAAILTIVLIVLTVWIVQFWREDSDGVLLFFAGMAGISALTVIGGTAWGMYPYQAEYHQWRDVTGTVEKIDSRLIGTSGGSMEDKFAVRFAESGDQYACDDTRCAQVEEGDELTLSCKRAWQFTGTDGYDCRFVATEPAR